MHLDIVSVTHTRKEEQEKQETTQKCEKTEKKVDVPPGCPHHFGYLATRAKDENILQECLTCRKVFDCLMQINISTQER